MKYELRIFSFDTFFLSHFLRFLIDFGSNYMEKFGKEKLKFFNVFQILKNKIQLNFTKRS